jgi:hypothetical protein
LQLAAAAVVAAAAYAAVMSVGYFAGGIARHRVEAAWFIFVAIAIVAGVARCSSWSAARAETPPRFATSVLLAMVALTATAAYFPALRIGFLSDDFVLVDRALRHDVFSASSSGFFRPVPLIVWGVLLLPGAAAGALAIHLLNLVLHALNAVLLEQLARRVGLSAEAAILAAVVFLCFPAGVEAVAWASGIQDVLLTTAVLAFVLLATARPTRLTVAGAALALMLALGTKETAVAAPVLALLIAVRRGLRWQDVGVPIAALAMTGAYAAWRVASAPAGSGGLIPSRYAAKQMISVAFSSLAIPFTSGALVSHPMGGVILSLLLVGLVAGAALRGPRHGAEFPASLRAAVWVVAAIVPVNALFFISGNLQGSRYLYLPACGWALLVAAAASVLPVGRRGVMAIATVIAVAGIAGIHVHLVDWLNAARTRDAVLTSARAALDARSCRPLAFAQIPDSWRGAYLFRNGFIEALTLSGVTPGAATIGRAVPACMVIWTGMAFRPDE